MGVAAAILGEDPDEPRVTARRVIAVVPTIVATYWRYRRGNEPVEPRDDLHHAANYLYMLTGEEPTEAAVWGLETYLNTVVDHGLNASTFSGRVVVSTESDVVSVATVAVGTLKGPLHGGAPGPVLEMLQAVHESGDPAGYVEETLDAGERLMGFGHRVYRRSRPSASGLDPEGEGRQKIDQTTGPTMSTVRKPQRRIKDLNPTLTETVRKCDSSQNPRLWRGATGVVGRCGAAGPHGRTERSGVNSSRPISGRSRGIKFACDGTARFGTCGQDGEASGLVPEVLHTALLLDGVGIPRELFTPTFAVSRVGGWMAHALEQLEDNRLVRPSSQYVGATDRSWVPAEDR